MGKGTVNPEGYRLVTRHGHPLANKRGLVLEHRAVLFDGIGPRRHRCHWCGGWLAWKPSERDSAMETHVDHLDDDRLNNDPANLVPSCRSCNTKRSVAKTALLPLAGSIRDAPMAAAELIDKLARHCGRRGERARYLTSLDLIVLASLVRGQAYPTPLED